MLYYAIIFFIIALVAGIFGFFGIVSSLAWMGKVLFIGFIIAAIVAMVRHHRRTV